MFVSGGSIVIIISSVIGIFFDSFWVNNVVSQLFSLNLVKSEEFELILVELNTVILEENIMMDISSITDYIFFENMQQLDFLFFVVQQFFINGENSSAVGEFK